MYKTLFQILKSIKQKTCKVFYLDHVVSFAKVYCVSKPHNVNTPYCFVRVMPIPPGK